jgi:hypothetical protein
MKVRTMNTHKITIRVNNKSPKYGYGFHKMNNGYRIDVPFASYTNWNDTAKPTIRAHPEYTAKFWEAIMSHDYNSKYIKTHTKGLRLIVENNRKRTTRTYRVSEIIN